MNANLLRQYVEKKDALEAAKLQVSILTTEIETMQTVVLEQFADAGVTSVKLDGRTIYLSGQTWARPLPDVDIAAALEECGLSDMVKKTVNTSSLSSWVREHTADGAELPPPLAAALVVRKEWQVKVRR